MGLTDLFSDTNYRVELEKDLSLKRQMLDAIVIEEEVSEQHSSGLIDPPDGLDDLGRHNLMTYKSHKESLGAWALDELLGHFVNYRKVVSRDEPRLVPVEEFRLFAVSARYPKKLLSKRSCEEIAPGISDVRWGERKIRIVVLSKVSREPRNAFWELFSGVPSRVEEGARFYRWKVSNLSSVLGKLFEKYRIEGLTMPYTVEDYRRELIEETLASMPVSELLKHANGRKLAEEALASMPMSEFLKHANGRKLAEEALASMPVSELLKHVSTEQLLDGLTPEQLLDGLTPEQLLDGLTPEQLLDGLTPEQLCRGLTPEQLLDGLSREQILEYLKKLDSQP